MFRKVLLLSVLILVVVPIANAGLVSDFNGDNNVTIDDVVFLLAWIQIGRISDAAKIKTRAQEILPTVSGNVVNIPSLSTDDITNNGSITIDDVVFILSWIQASRNYDSTTVLNRAKEILPNVLGTFERYPGLEVGTSTIPIGIGDPDNPITPY